MHLNFFTINALYSDCGEKQICLFSRNLFKIWCGIWYFWWNTTRHYIIYRVFHNCMSIQMCESVHGFKWRRSYKHRRFKEKTSYYGNETFTDNLYAQIYLLYRHYRHTRMNCTVYLFNYLYLNTYILIIISAQINHKKSNLRVK